MLESRHHGKIGRTSTHVPAAGVTDIDTTAMSEQGFVNALSGKIMSGPIGISEAVVINNAN